MITSGFKKSFWSVAVCLIFISTIAVASYRNTTESQPMASGTQSMSTTQYGNGDAFLEGSQIHGRAGTLQSVDKAIGMSVNNEQGNKIGTIKDFILDHNRNAVSYVILSSGTKYYPVPWSAFSTGDKNYMLNISKDKLIGAPTIKSLDPVLLNASVTQMVQSFYSKQLSAGKEFTGKSNTSMFKETPNFTSCEKIIGINIKNDENQKIAKLSDVIFDVRQGNVAYGLASFRGFFGFAQKTAAVPWSAIQLQPRQKVADLNIASLNADERLLTSAVIEKGDLAKLNDPTFARQIHQDFAKAPYWEIYGYVPPTSEGMTRGAGVAAGAVTSGAWAADSKYNKSFKPDAVTTVEGTVKSIDTFTPAFGSTAGLEIKIKTTANETETVQLAPKNWMDHNIKFTVGDRVTVTGSKVTHGLGKVIMASTVNKGDQTLKLRNEQGRPLWTSSEMNRGTMSSGPNRGSQPKQ
jgi:sporulation protein YlmC with PRC-barrel domain